MTIRRKIWHRTDSPGHHLVSTQKMRVLDTVGCLAIGHYACSNCYGSGTDGHSSPMASQLQEAPRRTYPCGDCDGMGTEYGAGLLELPFTLNAAPVGGTRP